MQHIQDPLKRMFLNGGEMGRRILEHDWTKTSLGTIETWPHSLITSLSLILNAHQPMWIGWGQELIFFYNDVYLPVLSLSKHSWALGRPTSEVWAEVWNECGPLMDNVLQKGEPCFVNDMRLFMNRGDFMEETFFSFSYNPIQDNSGKVVGLFCPCNDVSQGVLNARRIKTLSDLSVSQLGKKTVKSACFTGMESLAKNPDDIPFAILYLIEEDNNIARLEKTIGIPTDLSSVIPLSVELDNENTTWSMSEVFHSLQPKIISIKHIESFPLGLSNQRLSECLVLPLIPSTQEKPAGILIAGINPTRKLDDAYRTFYNLVTGHFANALQSAKIIEDEKKQSEKLKEIDKAKTVFFSNISHEFRTPLTLMLGPIEDLLNDKNPPLKTSQYQKLYLAHRNAARLLKLVNTLLDFSRIEANRLQAVFEPTDLSHLTEDLASMFRTTIENAGLQFSINVSQFQDDVFVDKEMWEKIVFNLLSNAFKFTLKGSIQLSLYKENETVKLVVKDSGVGIPSSELPHLFERFHRIEGTQGRSFEGSGIGLALIQDLVHMHKGTITVQSEVGVGTTFTLTLQLGNSHLPAELCRQKRLHYKPAGLGKIYIDEAKQWISDGSSSEKNTSMDDSDYQSVINRIKKTKSTYKILVVDDNLDMQRYISTLLNPIGEVETANDGESAWYKILKNPPDLILSDVMMPKINGFELIQKLREDPQLKLIPIILLSARAGEEARIEGIQSGADDYLIKPFAAKELVARVCTQLELGQLRIKLEERVKQRTEELQRIYKTLNREMLEKLELEKNLFKKNTEISLIKEYSDKQIDFINFICHEIRNSLTIIYGATSLLQTKMMSVEKIIRHHSIGIESTVIAQLTQLFTQIKGNLDALEHSSQQQKIIVNDVLDMAKLEYDKIELNPRSFQLQQFFSKIKKMFDPQFEKKQLSFTVNIPDNETWIEADSHRLTQVITNLITNALKFTEKGGVTLSVSITQHPEASILSMSVEDTGIGMNESEISKLFKPFSQANAQTSSQYGGSGLGLVICKKLIEKMGGEIQVVSQKGEGTKFMFSVKCANLASRDRLESPATCKIINRD